MHTNIGVDECKDILLEIVDPIYKIINISTDVIDNKILKQLDERG
jgi:hypothetical protein